jgi:hypothetical protein
VSAIIAAFVGAAIQHVCLMIFGAANSPYEATVRVYCYANSTGVIFIGLVPLLALVAGLGFVVAGPEGALAGAVLIGGLLGGAAFIWALAIQVIGLREAHDTTTGRALGAVLLPVLVLFCCAGGVVGFALMAARKGM